MQTDLYQLYFHTGIIVGRARELALRGDKDQARDYLRYLRNGRVVQLLKGLDEEKFRADVAHLAWKVGELEKECHPSHPVNPLLRHQ